jgi:hypothetical protein
VSIEELPEEIWLDLQGFFMNSTGLYYEGWAFTPEEGKQRSYCVQAKIIKAGFQPVEKED